MKTYLGLILSAIYGLLIRFLGERDVMEINSLSYLILVPMAIGFIPFFYKESRYRTTWPIAVFFPLLSVVIYLITAVITGLEDLICFFIIGLPYILFSVVVSVILFMVLKKKRRDTGSENDIVDQLSVSVLLLPILFGQIEKQFPKMETRMELAREIQINLPDTVVWNNLHAIPDLSGVQASGIFSYLGVPRPIKSTYNRTENIRLGYFENGIVLHESVVKEIPCKELVFAMDVNKSSLGSSPTLKHVLKGKSLKFHSIIYELKRINKHATTLRLKTDFSIYSNVPFYGTFWSKGIIADFENSLLRSLKQVLETNKK